MKNAGLVLAALIFLSIQLKETHGKAPNNGNIHGGGTVDIECNRQSHKKSEDSDSALDEKSCSGIHADPKDCSAYYECKYGQSVKQYCKGGKKFNAIKGKCDDPKNVNCKRRCLGDMKRTAENNGASQKERITARISRSIDESVEENIRDMTQKRSRRHRRHHHHHHHHHLHKRSKFYGRHKRHKSHSKKRKLKSSQSTVDSGAKRTPNVKLKVQFKGPNLSGTLESSDPLNPKEGDLTLQAVQNAEQGDLNYAQALANQGNFDNPFNSAPFGHPFSDENKGDFVVQASRMADGTVQTSTSIRPKKIDQQASDTVQNDQANGQMNLANLLRNSFRTATEEKEDKNKDTEQASGATTTQTAPDSGNGNRNKTNTLKGLMETISLLKAISSGNSTNSSRGNDAKNNNSPVNQNVEPSKTNPSSEASKETSTTVSGQNSEGNLNSDKGKSESSSGADTKVNPHADRPKDKSESVKGEKSEEKNTKSDESKDGSAAKDNSKSDSSGGKTVGSGVLLLINKKTNNSNEDTSKSKTHGVIIMPNIGTALKVEKSDRNSSDDKGQRNPSDKKNESKQTPTEMSNNKVADTLTNQPTPTISNLMGLIGNLVQNKLQNKLNQTGGGPKVTLGDSKGMTKQDLDKNITIGKINVSLQSAERSGKQTSEDQSRFADAHYHPTVAMKPTTNTISFQLSGLPVMPSKDRGDALLDQSHITRQGSSATALEMSQAPENALPPSRVQYAQPEASQPVSTNSTQSFNNKLSPVPVMRIRLKASQNAATAAIQDQTDSAKERPSSIIINALRGNGNGGRFNDELKKPLHTTTVIIKNYHKDAKPVSYGTEDQFDTLPMKGSDDFDAYGNRRPSSPVISMNDAADLLDDDKALTDNTAMQNSLFNPEGAAISERKEDSMKMAQGILRESEFHPGVGNEEDFAQALLHQDDMPKFPQKMAIKENPRVAPVPVNLPSEKAGAFQNHRFKSVEKPQVTQPHGPVVTGYNNYGPQPMGMQDSSQGDYMQSMNDSPMGETGVGVGQGIQMGGGGRTAAGVGGGRGTMPVEMQPISANEDDMNKSMNQALNNMQDMAMKQMQDKFPGMQITMKAPSNDDEENEEEGQQQEQQQQQQEESGDNQEETSSGSNQEESREEERKKDNGKKEKEEKEERKEKEEKGDKDGKGGGKGDKDDKGKKEKDSKGKKEKSDKDDKEKEKSNKSDKSNSKDKKEKEEDQSDQNAIVNQAGANKAPTVDIKHLDPREMCKDKASGVYANDADPSKFIICYNGVTEERQCSNGMVFNPREKVCETTSDKASKLQDQSKPKSKETSNDAVKSNPHETRARPSPFKTIT